MRVVVTGGHGAVGQWVIRELTRAQGDECPHDVTVFDTSPGPRRRRVRSIVGDHASPSDLGRAFRGADAVIHLSAVQDGDEDVYDRNVRGTLNVFEAAHLSGVSRVIYWGSLSALGWSLPDNDFLPDYLPIDEDHPLRAKDPYGRSKADGEAIARSYAGETEMEVLTLRHAYAVSPRIMASLWETNGWPDPIYVHLAYVDVRDLARAARLAVEADLAGYTVVTAVADDSRVAEPLSDLLPRLRPEIGDLASALSGTSSSVSNARARAVLGWSPERSWRTLPLPEQAQRVVASRTKATARLIAPRTYSRIREIRRRAAG